MMAGRRYIGCIAQFGNTPEVFSKQMANHAFRRFRNTYLKNYTDCPKGLYEYWLGHAGKDMSDLYDKIRQDVPFRKMRAEKSGFGFELPSVTECTEKRGSIRSR